ncbi:glycosyltransferase [Kineococcus sp. GCM10028916]|uniref:glycosyltransferase n=1 Tax=Kineococcus sp. GCM10028916 TaxID=3273394 RepID=UPI003632D18B
MSGGPIALWKTTLLPRSETFVRTQGESLTRYQPHYVGLTDARELELPADRTLLLDRLHRRPRLAVAAAKVTGTSALLSAELVKRRVVLLHAHFGTEAWRGLQLARRVGVPLVVTFHGADATTNDRALRRMSASGREYVRHRATIFREAALCIAVSDFIAERVVAAGCPPEKIRSHQVGVDFSAFASPGHERLRAGVLFVGRLVEKKGVAYLLEALALLRARGCEVSAVIAGDGPDKAQLQAFAERHCPTVLFVGSLSHEDVRAHMQRASVLVVPSVQARNGDSEGLPTVIREAQAAGLPVVASRSAGAPEAIEDGITGILVDPHDVVGLARSIHRVVTSPRLQDTLRRRAMDAARAHDITHQGNLLESLYDRVLAEHLS